MAVVIIMLTAEIKFLCELWWIALYAGSDATVQTFIIQGDVLDNNLIHVSNKTNLNHLSVIC